uniref:Uncharacterized protein n=1 Tax=Tanacetum cinerariifolium TaxID=118510 RepID=A0A6L2J4Q3_TANCI|nr:hypothetical protein [Tanacetum cinerariifolium]
MKYASTSSGLAKETSYLDNQLKRETFVVSLGGEGRALSNSGSINKFGVKKKTMTINEPIHDVEEAAIRLDKMLSADEQRQKNEREKQKAIVIKTNESDGDDDEAKGFNVNSRNEKMQTPFFPHYSTHKTSSYDDIYRHLYENCTHISRHWLAKGCRNARVNLL